METKFPKFNWKGAEQFLQNKHLSDGPSPTHFPSPIITTALPLLYQNNLLKHPTQLSAKTKTSPETPPKLDGAHQKLCEEISSFPLSILF